MATLNHRVGKAITSQVERVNTLSYQELADRLEAAIQTINSLRLEKRSLERRMFSKEVESTEDIRDWKGETYENRPVITLSEAAKRAGKHYQSAYRRVHTGKWQATQLPSGDWRVFADQPLT